MESISTEKDWAKLARWLQTNPSPRIQNELDSWLSESEENQVGFEKWRQAKLSARTVDGRLPSVDDIWDSVKGDLGFQRVKSKRKSSGKRSSSSNKQKIYGRAWFVAIAAMIGFSLFLWILGMMRATMGF